MSAPESYVPGNTPGATPAGWDSAGSNFTIPGNLTVGGTIYGSAPGDANNHPTAPAGVVSLTAGAVGTTAAGTISPTTNAGAAPTVSAIAAGAATDRRGVFTLNPVTGGGAQSAGVTVEVRFAVPYATAPLVVQIEGMNITAPAAPVDVAAYATSITAAGFSITTAVLTTANNYQFTYVVTP